MIDLHTHSNISDGSYSPEEIVELASQLGLKAVALTDHDSVAGLDRARKAAEYFNVTLVPGIELEIDFYPGEFHMLGLGLKEWDNDFRIHLDEIMRRRVDRNLKIIDKMKKEGFDVSYHEVQELADGYMVGRPHFAKLLIKKGIVKSFKEAFDKYLAIGKPFYEKKEAFSVEEGIDLIHSVGGKAILAHPHSLFLSWGRLPEHLETWRAIGLDGIEVYHPGCNLHHADRLIKLAEKYGFLLTGGSDFHGKNHPDRKMGKSSEGADIPDEFLQGIM